MNIRKELALLIKEKKKSCKTEKEENKAVNLARQEINVKYGKDWRSKEAIKSYQRNPQHIGTDIPDGDEWYHYAQTADDF